MKVCSVDDNIVVSDIVRRKGNKIKKAFNNEGCDVVLFFDKISRIPKDEANYVVRVLGLKRNNYLPNVEGFIDDYCSVVGGSDYKRFKKTSVCEIGIDRFYGKSKDELKKIDRFSFTKHNLFDDFALIKASIDNNVKILFSNDKKDIYSRNDLIKKYTKEKELNEMDIKMLNFS